MIRRARPEDIPHLIGLMADFYAEGGYRLDHARAADAFAAILADEHLGWVWLIEAEGNLVGHIVVTLRFGMEHGGLIACLDDLYVIPSHRNRGLSTAALLQVRDICEAHGIRAMTVEVGHGNEPAQRVYRRVGFAESPGRQLLALALADPSHVV